MATNTLKHKINWYLAIIRPGAHPTAVGNLPSGACLRQRPEEAGKKGYESDAGHLPKVNERFCVLAAS